MGGCAGGYQQRTMNESSEPESDVHCCNTAEGTTVLMVMISRMENTATKPKLRGEGLIMK